jgi:hypothetical protein
MSIDYMNGNAVRIGVYCLLAFLTAISTDVNAGHFTAATLIAGVMAAGIAYKAFRSIPKPSGDNPPADPPRDPMLPV